MTNSNPQLAFSRCCETAMDGMSLEDGPALTGNGCCPLCGGSLTYFFWPIDAFVCAVDELSWSSATALDHKAGLAEYSDRTQSSAWST